MHLPTTFHITPLLSATGQIPPGNRNGFPEINGWDVDPIRKAVPPPELLFICRRAARIADCPSFFVGKLLFYFLTSSDFPVISAGCSIPINSIIVGMISARQPSSRSPYAGSALIRINGTGLVVCAVNGAFVS